ncbi:hypothetical protein HOC90_03475 [Candidatus Falkowbacteria bacterium]|nr:hypothetical protein [Candidatus Falkowbacteria bacterium]
MWGYYKTISSYNEDSSENINTNSRNNNNQGFPEEEKINSLINDNTDINKNTEIVSPQEMQLKSIIVLFAERLGSYSTDTYNFSNLTEVRYLTTNRMQNEIDGLMKNSLLKKDVEYYGVTTRAISVKILDLEDDSSIIQAIVSCQKEETKGDQKPTTKIKYQNLKIKLIKSGDKWLIDEAIWE